MEAMIITEYLLPLVFIILSMAFIVFFNQKLGARSLKLPPGTSGWPIVGESMQYALVGSKKFINDRMKNCSEDVFQTTLLGEQMAVFCGANGNKFLFTNENKVLISWWNASIKKALFPPEYFENSKRKMSALRRSFLHDIIRPNSLKQFIPVMDAMAREHIEKHWSPNNEVKAFHVSKKYTFDLACRVFLNIEDSKIIKKLADPFHLVIDGLFSIPIDFPGTPCNRAIKGGKKVQEELLWIIRSRRNELIEKKEIAGQDLLSRMLLFVDEDGEIMNEPEIIHNIIGLLLASYETTGTAVAFVLKHLAELPHIYDEVFREQMAIAKTKGPNDLLNWEDIEKMKYSWNVGRESLRMAPPAQGAFKEATADFNYAGFTIPKGWKL